MPESRVSQLHHLHRCLGPPGVPVSGRFCHRHEEPGDQGGGQGPAHGGPGEHRQPGSHTLTHWAVRLRSPGMPILRFFRYFLSDPFSIFSYFVFLFLNFLSAFVFIFCETARTHRFFSYFHKSPVASLYIKLHRWACT